MAEPSKQQQQRSEMQQTFGEVLEILQTTSQMDTKNLNVDDLLKQMEHTLESLSEKAEVIYKRTGMSKDELEAYANDPKNFSKEEWSLLEQIRGELNRYKQDAENIIGVDLKTAVRPSSLGATIPGQADGKHKKSRKNWIPS